VEIPFASWMISQTTTMESEMEQAQTALLVTQNTCREKLADWEYNVLWETLLRDFAEKSNFTSPSERGDIEARIVKPRHALGAHAGHYTQDTLLSADDLFSQECAKDAMKVSLDLIFSPFINGTLATQVLLVRYFSFQSKPYSCNMDFKSKSSSSSGSKLVASKPSSDSKNSSSSMMSLQDSQQRCLQLWFDFVNEDGLLQILDVSLQATFFSKLLVEMFSGTCTVSDSLNHRAFFEFCFNGKNKLIVDFSEYEEALT